MSFYDYIGISPEHFEVEYLNADLVRVDWSPYDVKNNGSMPVNLDRVDSSKGYVFHNCVVCCGDCNQMKMDFTLEDFKARIKRIAMHLGL